MHKKKEINIDFVGEEVSSPAIKPLTHDMLKKLEEIEEASKEAEMV